MHRDIYTSLRDVYREKLVAAKSSLFCEKIRESACDVKASYRVTNDINGREQPPVLPECNDSHDRGFGGTFSSTFLRKDYECPQYNV